MATAKKSAARKSAAKKGGRATAKKGGGRSAAKKSSGSSRSSGAAKRGSGRSTAKRGSRRGSGQGRANAAFMKAMQPSSDLAAVVGDRPMPRTEVTKRLWDYIKKNNLQDAKNRRQINADDKLRPVFNGKRSVSMFEMTKLVNGHLSDT